MPVTTGRDSKGCFAQWGNQKKYRYPCGNTSAMNKAKQRAHIQGSVISKATGRKYEKMDNLVKQIVFRSSVGKKSKKNKLGIMESAFVRAALSKVWTKKDFERHDEHFGLTEAEKSARDKPGGSNVGKYKSGPFCGPSGGAPAGSFPINTRKRAVAALSYARNAPNPAGIKACV